MWVVKEAHTKEEIERIIRLRFAILREPWNQPAETATDQMEEKSVNAYIEDAKGIVVACGRLQENENKTGQIRFMAVDHGYHGKGLGKLIVQHLEKRAKELKLKTVELQARENAVRFYQSCGYKIKEKTFLLWGQIQHYLMQKSF